MGLPGSQSLLTHIARLSRSAFAANTAILASGTAISQGILFLSTLLLTRLYSPEAFGLFTLYFASVQLISSLSCGRYEVAIVLPKSDETALAVFSVGLFLSGLATCLVAFGGPILLGVLPEHFAPLLSNLSLAVAGVCVCGANLNFTYWMTRKKRFRVQAVCRILSSSVMAILQVMFFFGGLESEGLIAGWLSGQIVLGVAYAIFMIRMKPPLKSWSLGRAWKAGCRYRKFPLISVWSIGLNQLSNLAPISLLTSYYGLEVVGFYGLAQRILGVPSSLIGTAISQVFLQKASEERRRNGSAGPLVRRLVKYLALASIVPFVVFSILAPQLFPLLFGSGWRVAGIFVLYLTPLFWARFISAPLSMINNIFEKQQIALVWQAGLAGLACGIVYLSRNQSIGTTLVSMSILLSCWYFLLIFVVIRVSQNENLVWRRPVSGGSPN